jgi:uncharacterized membrane protein
MRTVLRPEPSSGEYRIPQMRPTAATESRVPAGRRRLDNVDLLRGLVMVIMVFGTRWITHYCAPVFVFLAGASAWFAGTRRTRGQLARFLLTRGLWLILLEVTVISLGWYFSTRWTMGARAQVIWAIGASMVVLAGLIHLPRAAVAAFGLALVVGHNLLDGIAPAAFGAVAPLWQALHVPGELGIVSLRYPLVPWVGVMALGYAVGPAVFSQDAGAPRRLAWAGALMVLGFVVLRTLNGYGDPSPRLDDGSPALLAMSFLNLTKYPPSLLFLLMTLGPALVALVLLRRAKGPVAWCTRSRLPPVSHRAFPTPPSAWSPAGCRRATASGCPSSISSGSPWWRHSTRCAGGTRRSRRGAGRGGCRTSEASS